MFFTFIAYIRTAFHPVIFQSNAKEAHSVVTTISKNEFTLVASYILIYGMAM